MRFKRALDREECMDGDVRKERENNKNATKE